jgi:hypothetical protein
VSDEQDKGVVFEAEAEENGCADVVDEVAFGDEDTEVDSVELVSFDWVITGTNIGFLLIDGNDKDLVIFGGKLGSGLRGRLVDGTTGRSLILLFGDNPNGSFGADFGKETRSGGCFGIISSHTEGEDGTLFSKAFVPSVSKDVLVFAEVWGVFEVMGEREFCDATRGTSELLDNRGKLFKDIPPDFGSFEMGNESSEDISMKSDGIGNVKEAGML